MSYSNGLLSYTIGITSGGQPGTPGPSGPPGPACARGPAGAQGPAGHAGSQGQGFALTRDGNCDLQNKKKNSQM